MTQVHLVCNIAGDYENNRCITLIYTGQFKMVISGPDFSAKNKEKVYINIDSETGSFPSAIFVL